MTVSSDNLVQATWSMPCEVIPFRGVVSHYFVRVNPSNMSPTDFVMSSGLIRGIAFRAIAGVYSYRPSGIENEDVLAGDIQEFRRSQNSVCVRVMHLFCKPDTGYVVIKRRDSGGDSVDFFFHGQSIFDDDRTAVVHDLSRRITLVPRLISVNAALALGIGFVDKAAQAMKIYGIIRNKSSLGPLAILNILDHVCKQWTKTRSVGLSIERSADTKLERSIVWWQKADDQEAYICLTKKRMGDRPVGKGSFKKMRLAISVNRLILLVTGSTCDTREMRHESTIYEELRGLGIAEPISPVVEYDSKDRIKSRFLTRRADGALSYFMSNIKRLSFENRVDYCLCLFNLLSDLHAKNIAHRDLKPCNVLLFGDKIKLVDFGTASHLPAPFGEVTTIDYVSPEVAESLLWGERPFCPMKADVWAAGTICCYIVTGDWPNKGAGMEAYKGYMRIAAMSTNWFLEFARRYTISQSLPRDFLNIINRMLAIDPSERYTAEEAFWALEDFKTRSRPSPSLSASSGPA